MTKKYKITDGPTLAYRGRYMRAGDIVHMGDEEMGVFSKEVRARFVVLKAEIDASAGEADRAFDGVSDEGRPPPADSENKSAHVAYAVEVLGLAEADVNRLKKAEVIALIKKTVDAA